jgi:hypothetical protein
MLTSISNSQPEWTSASEAVFDAACPGRHLAQSRLPAPFWNGDSSSHLRIRAWLACQKIELTGGEMRIAEECKRTEWQVWTNWAGEKVCPEKTLRNKTISIQFGILKHSGTLDAVHISEQRALVLKYDLEAGPDHGLESQDNPELCDLAILAANKFELLEVSIAVIRPFGTRQPTIYVYKMEDFFFTGMKALVERVSASHIPDAPRVAGEAQCRRCRFSAQCPERAALAVEAEPVLHMAGAGAKNWWPSPAKAVNEPALVH